MDPFYVIFGREIYHGLCSCNIIYPFRITSINVRPKRKPRVKFDDTNFELWINVIILYTYLIIMVCKISGVE